MKKVLITGGTGLVGQHLCKKLQENGYEVAILSRTSNPNSPFKTYIWNVEKNEMDVASVKNCDYIIHLAGIGIADKKWTAKRKEQILHSRIQSGEIILNTVAKHNPHLKTFITASAIGYYGAITSEKIFKETDSPANDFLGEVCSKWEQVANGFQEIGIRSVKVRTGIVLTKEGGALEKIKTPIKIGVGSAIGSGNQYFPWIHIDDLCGIYLKALEDNTIKGAYNAVTPEHITNKEFSKKVAKSINKPFWFPNVPAFALKLLFGEMAVILLTGSRISSKKIQETNFQFKFSSLENALADLNS